MGVIIPSVWTVPSLRVLLDGQIERGFTLLPADRRAGLRRAYIWLISPNSGNASLRGPHICLGMAPYRPQSVRVLMGLLTGAPRNLFQSHVSRHGLGRLESKLRGE